uniref:Uncharacterized protein n=1 Tax=Romanomermis culicivorax TaxID=13658 RepID=A0A915JKM6_ROMCU
MVKNVLLHPKDCLMIMLKFAKVVAVVLNCPANDAENAKLGVSKMELFIRKVEVFIRKVEVLISVGLALEKAMLKRPVKCPIKNRGGKLLNSRKFLGIITNRHLVEKRHFHQKGLDNFLMVEFFIFILEKKLDIGQNSTEEGGMVFTSTQSHGI